jgi:plastocyanin
MSAARIIPAALLATLALAGTAVADDGGNVVRVRDACDPATFNAMFGPGFCETDDHGIALDDAVAQLQKHGSIRGWRFSPKSIHIDEGESVVARFTRGGENHTFTEVAEFGAGCVQLINDVGGFTGPPAADCSLIPSTTVGRDVPELTVSGLARGEHYFECLIHPWMRTTVTVR